jgi:hypothetical protein
MELLFYEGAIELCNVEKSKMVLVISTVATLNMGERKKGRRRRGGTDKCDKIGNVVDLSGYNRICVNLLVFVDVKWHNDDNI